MTVGTVPETVSSDVIGILIVDDHPIVREGLARLIDQQSDMRCCGQAGNAAEALSLLESRSPRVAIVDLSLGENSGLEVIREMVRRLPELPVVVLSMHDEALHAERALRAGARGYVMKQAPTDQLLAAIHKVVTGEVYLSEKMTAQLLSSMSRKGSTPGESPLQRLTDREMEVFLLIARGMATREIAEAMSISPKTVDAHREHMKEKLGLSSAAELLRYAVAYAGELPRTPSKPAGQA